MIRHNVRSFIQETFSSIEIGSALEGWEEISILGDSIERIFVADVCEWTTPSKAQARIVAFARVTAESRDWEGGRRCAYGGQTPEKGTNNFDGEATT